MRAVIVIGELSYKAGPSINGVRLVRALLSQDIDAWLLHQTHPNACDPELLQQLNSRAIQLPPRHPLDPRMSLDFFAAIKRLKPHLVHFNLPTHAMVLSPLCKLLRLPVVYTMRNLLEYNAPWIQRWLKFVGPRYIDAFVAVSQAVAQNIQTHHLSRRPPVVIHNGLSMPSPSQLSTWRHQARATFNIPHDALLLGTVGRLAPDKKQIYLFHALDILHRQGIHFHFWVIGDGAAREELESFCREKSLPNVSFLGWRKDVLHLLPALDIFVFHSMPFSEGLPTVVVEAASCSLPMVVADIACLREVFRPDGEVLFAKPANPDDFASKILQLIHDPSLRSTLAAAARRRVSETFDIQVTARQYIELYRHLIEARQK